MSTKRSFAKINFLLAVFFCLASMNVYAQETKPFSINESPLGAPTGPVMDYAGVLDANTKQALEKRLIEFRDKTNPKVELAVAIVKTTGDRPIFDYSLAVARGWKIGSQEDDNPSALLFVAIDDRKYFTQVSKDLEDELPDGVVGQLQRQYLVPAFRQSNYAKGIAETMEAYIRTIESKQTGEQPPVAGTTPKNTKRGVLGTGSCGLFICLGIIFIIFLAGLSGSRKRSGKDNDRWRGGGFGGGGGSSVLPWIIGSAIANSLGNNSSGGGSSDWGGSSGGDSWGGFGGGGDFGGGGAGGDW